MKKIIHKWFWIWDFEKEEKWLNKMSAKGLQLTGVGFCRYTFNEGIPEEYNYKLEMLNGWPENSENESYIRFLEETGVEHIGNMLRWAYFRKKTSQGEFQLFSDLNSKIAYLKRMLNLLLIIFPFLIINLISNISNYFDYGRKTSLILGGLMFTLLLIYIYGISLFYLKIKKMKKEKRIRE